MEDLWSKTPNLPMIPLIQQCVEFLRSKAINEEGLFRVNGSTTALVELQQVYEHGKVPELIGIHNVASFVKKFFRELPDPLIPFHTHDELKSILLYNGRTEGNDESTNSNGGNGNAEVVFSPEEKVERCRKILSTVSKRHWQVMNYFFQFLNELVREEHSKKNMMNTNNIGK